MYIITYVDYYIGWGHIKGFEICIFHNVKYNNIIKDIVTPIYFNLN